MLRILVNNIALDLPEDFSIDLEWNSPMWQFNEIAGDYSLRADVPRTPTNDRVFGHYARADVQKRLEDFDCEIWHSGFKLVSGTLTLEENLSRGRYRFQVVYNKGKFAAGIKDRLLTELRASYPNRPDEYYRRNAAWADPSQPITGTIIVRHNGVTITQPVLGTMAATLQSLANQVNANSNILLTAVYNNVGFLHSVAFFSVYKVGEAGFFDPAGFNAQSVFPGEIPGNTGWLVDENVNYPLGWATKVAEGTWPTRPFTFFTVYHPEAFEGENPDYEYYVNWCGNTPVLANRKIYTNIDLGNGNGTMVAAVANCPYFYLHEVLTKLFAEQGYVLKGGFMDDTELRQLVLINHTLTERVQSYTNRVPLLLMAQELNIGEHVPPEKMEELLISLSALFGLVWDVDSQGTATVHYLKDLLQRQPKRDLTKKLLGDVMPDDLTLPNVLRMEVDSADGLTKEEIRDYTDWTQLTAVSSFANLPTGYVGDKVCCLVLNERRYYELSNDEELGTVWVAGGSDYETEYVAYEQSDELEVVSKASPLMMQRRDYELSLVNNDYPRRWKVPAVEQTATSRYFGTDAGSYGLRLLFYRGYKNDAYGRQYPLASWDATDYGNNSTGNYELQWAGDKGLYKRFWKQPMAYFAEARGFNAEMLLDARDLANMQSMLLEPFTAYVTDTGSMTWWLNQVRVRLTMEHISPAEVTLVAR